MVRLLTLCPSRVAPITLLATLILSFFLLSVAWGSRTEELNIVKRRLKEEVLGKSWKREGGRETDASSSPSRVALAGPSSVTSSP